MKNQSVNLPLVSICIPTYNSERYIEKMLISIVAQTYPNLEVIISDNCSTDNTYNILQYYSNRPRWTIRRNEVNIGALNNMSALVELAEGKYTAIYHADDIYEPNIVARGVSILENEPTVSLVSTMGYLIDSEDKILKEFELPDRFRGEKLISFDSVFAEILSQRPYFLITPSILTRTTFYKQNSRFEDRYKSSADYGKWFEILKKGDLVILNENLIKYRTHEQQGSQLEIKENLKIPDCINLYKDYALHNKNLHWNKYLYSYYKLMLVQAVKLNNIKNFKRSQIFILLIRRHGVKRFSFFMSALMIMNLIQIKLPLKYLIILKRLFKK